MSVKDIVTKLLLNKTVVIKTTKDKKDKYGRYLAEVYLVNELPRVDNLNINNYNLGNNYNELLYLFENSKIITVDVIKN